LRNLNENSVVETILNFGDLNSVRKLFDILGTEKVADIFYFHQSQKRTNYFPYKKSLKKAALRLMLFSSNESICVGKKGKVERLC